MSTQQVVHVVYGDQHDFFDLAGEFVAEVHTALAAAWGIPVDAISLVNGLEVGRKHLLQPGDELEFLSPQGEKGLGELLTPAQLMERWQITTQQYEELVRRGLPTLQMEDGTILHPEVSIDEWFRRGLVSPPSNNTSDPGPGFGLPPWCHSEAEDRPSAYVYGPLQGTQEQLGSWLFNDRKRDPRRLHRKVANGVIWVRKIHSRLYEVWFKNQHDYAAANAGRLKESRPDDGAS